MSLHAKGRLIRFPHGGVHFAARRDQRARRDDDELVKYSAADRHPKRDGTTVAAAREELAREAADELRERCPDGEDRRTGYVRVDVIKLDDAVERHRKVLIGDVLRADERPEQGDRVEDDAGDAEVHVLVRPRREAAVGAGAHDTFS